MERQDYIGVGKLTAWPEELDGVPGYTTEVTDDSNCWMEKEEFEKRFLCIGAEGTNTVSDQVVQDFMIGANGNDVSLRGELKTALVIALDRIGFVYTHSSSCVDPEKYDADKGCSLAMRNIENELRGKLGFVLQWALRGLEPYVSDDEILEPVKIDERDVYATCDN